MKNKKVTTNGEKQISNTKSTVAKLKGVIRTPYENNGIKLCVSPKSERRKFVKEMPPFTIVGGNLKQMRRLHKLRLPKEPKQVVCKVIKMGVDLSKRRAA